MIFARDSALAFGARRAISRVFVLTARRTHRSFSYLNRTPLRSVLTMLVELIVERWSGGGPTHV